MVTFTFVTLHGCGSCRCGCFGWLPHCTRVTGYTHGYVYGCGWLLRRWLLQLPHGFWFLYLPRTVTHYTFAGCHALRAHAHLRLDFRCVRLLRFCLGLRLLVTRLVYTGCTRLLRSTVTAHCTAVCVAVACRCICHRCGLRTLAGSVPRLPGLPFPAVCLPFYLPRLPRCSHAVAATGFLRFTTAFWRLHVRAPHTFRLVTRLHTWLPRLYHIHGLLRLPACRTRTRCLYHLYLHRTVYLPGVLRFCYALCRSRTVGCYTFGYALFCTVTRTHFHCVIAGWLLYLDSLPLRFLGSLCHCRGCYGYAGSAYVQLPPAFTGSAHLHSIPAVAVAGCTRIAVAVRFTFCGYTRTFPDCWLPAFPFPTFGCTVRLVRCTFYRCSRTHTTTPVTGCYPGLLPRLVGHTRFVTTFYIAVHAPLWLPLPAHTRVVRCPPCCHAFAHIAFVTVRLRVYTHCRCTGWLRVYYFAHRTPVHVPRFYAVTAVAVTLRAPFVACYHIRLPRTHADAHTTRLTHVYLPRIPHRTAAYCGYVAVCYLYGCVTGYLRLFRSVRLPCVTRITPHCHLYRTLHTAVVTPYTLRYACVIPRFCHFGFCCYTVTRLLPRYGSCSLYHVLAPTVHARFFLYRSVGCRTHAVCGLPFGYTLPGCGWFGCLVATDCYRTLRYRAACGCVLPPVGYAVALRTYTHGLLPRSTAMPVHPGCGCTLPAVAFTTRCLVLTRGSPRHATAPDLCRLRSCWLPHCVTVPVLRFLSPVAVAVGFIRRSVPRYLVVAPLPTPRVLVPLHHARLPCLPTAPCLPPPVRIPCLPPTVLPPLRFYPHYGCARLFTALRIRYTVACVC